MMNPEFYKYERLMIECSWILASVASEGGVFLKQMMMDNLIQTGLNLLRHPNNQVKGNAIWLLTSIAAESLKYRDMLIELGIVIELLLQSMSLRRSLIPNVVSLIAQIVRGELKESGEPIYLDDPKKVPFKVNSRKEITVYGSWSH